MPHTIPPMAQYPEVNWRAHLQPDEWKDCLDSWILIGGAHLSLTSNEFQKISINDDSIPIFIYTFVTQMALLDEPFSTEDSSRLKLIRKMCYLLSFRLLESKSPPKVLLNWEFLADARKIFGRNNARKLFSLVPTNHISNLESSIVPLKTFFIKELDFGINGDLMKVESQLRRLNHLLHAFPEISAFFMAGSDLLDAFISGFQVMNPPLRNAIISNMYLCLIGLTDDKKPNLSLLTDQLYSLKAAAEAHKAGPINSNDSLVAELVTLTPILKRLQQRVKKCDSSFCRANSILFSLKSFRLPVRNKRGRKIATMTIDKGKQKATNVNEYKNDLNVHINKHRMDLISKVQEFLPNLGSAFIERLLSEFGDNMELTISNILEGSLPSHLENLDKSEPLDNIGKVISNGQSTSIKNLPILPTRHNVFDNDEFDQLAVDNSQILFGHRNDSLTAENLLDDRSSAPNKAAIYSALKAFDLNDDEYDDTYDVADVGGAVDSAISEDDPDAHNSIQALSAHDETLFLAYKKNPEAFERNSAARRGKERESLKEQVGLTDEVIEGWALMLKRDPRFLQKLDARYECSRSAQRELASSAWRVGELGNKVNEENLSMSEKWTINPLKQASTQKGTARKSAAEIPADTSIKSARRGKEANKSSRGNHNRKSQRAKKFAGRGGFSG